MRGSAEGAALRRKGAEDGLLDADPLAGRSQSLDRSAGELGAQLSSLAGPAMQVAFLLWLPAHLCKDPLLQGISLCGMWLAAEL